MKKRHKMSPALMDLGEIIEKGPKIVRGHRLLEIARQPAKGVKRLPQKQLKRKGPVVTYVN